MNKKILLYSTYDSFINTGISLCKETFGKTPDKLYIHQIKKNQVSKEQAKNMPFKYKNIRRFFSSREVCDYDIIILSFGVKQHLLFNAQLCIYKLASVPLLISCMPGLGFNRPENFLCRIYSDIVLLNCRDDYNKFINSSKKYGYKKSKGLFYGLPQVSLESSHKTHTKKTKSIAFFDQLTLPTTTHEKKIIIDNLILYATTFPNRKVYIKPRLTSYEHTLHNRRLNILNILNKYYRGKTPDNLLVTHRDISELIKVTDLCLTVSSTVSIEYLIYGEKAILISDFGKKEKLLNTYFENSGIFASFQDLLDERIPRVNQEWFKHYVEIPNNRTLMLKKRVDTLLTQNYQQVFSKTNWDLEVKHLKYRYTSKLIDIAFMHLSQIVGKYISHIT